MHCGKVTREASAVHEICFLAPCGSCTAKAKVGRSCHFPKRLNREAYLQYFDAHHEVAIGEASVWYLMSKNAAEEIYQFNPKMKIIIMLRDPVKTIHAHYTQMLFNGLGDEDQMVLEEALGLENKRKRGECLPPNTPLPQALYYREIVSFANQVSRYQKCFSREQIHIVLQDDLMANTPKAVATTFSFLNVDPNHPIDTKVINKHKVVRFQTLRKLIAATPSGLKNAIPSGPREKLSRQLRKINSKHAKREPLPEGLAKALRHEFSEDISLLSELIQRDLTHWMPHR